MQKYPNSERSISSKHSLRCGDNGLFSVVIFYKDYKWAGGGMIEWDDFFLEGVLLFENNYVTKFGFLQLIFLLVSNNKYRVL